MLAAESTRLLKVPGMQKMLTSFAGSAAPPVVRAPAGEPVSTMVRAMSSELKAPPPAAPFCRQCVKLPVETDRKSTRLNSSHRTISYAVFCLKKKKDLKLEKLGKEKRLVP